MTETFLQMAERHREQDMLAKGEFEWTGKACSVGCFNYDLDQEPGDFAALAAWTGYPEWAHRVQEAIFEQLPENLSKDWHVDFARKCANVTDWDAFYHRFMISVLEIALPHDPSGVVQQVIDLYKRGKNVTEAEWSAAEKAARTATWDVRAAKAATWAAARTATCDVGAAKTAMWAAKAAAEATDHVVGAVLYAAEEDSYLAVSEAAWQKIAAAFMIS